MSLVWLVPLIIGVVIFILGVIFILWGRHEERHYYDGLVSRVDLREFFSHWPPRPEPGALKTGGWVGIIVGIIIAVIGFLLWYYGYRV
ncbi:MAG TPA: hypothetical protein VEH58_04140 [Dehalococcoidales bacterium]|nr:hypothetical protein [Dehalococcoidales bacterium]